MTTLDLILCASFLAFLFVYRVFWLVVMARKDRNRFWWTLNRIRTYVAIEPDPGPWRDRT